MKTNIIDQYSPQNTCQYEANRHVKYTFNKSKIYLQDKIDISDKLKHTVKTGDNQQVEFIYSLRSKRVTATVINKNGEKKQVRSEDLPKELKQISNPKGFITFLSNIHVKVNTLSNGDYKLYANQKGLGGMMSRRYMSGSITPSTQGNENFKRFESQQEQLHKQLLSYVQEEDYNQTQNISSTLVEQQHITDPEKVIFELYYQEDINTNVVQEQEKMKQEESQPQVPSTQSSLVKRFGINPEAVQYAAGYGIAGDRLHYVEQEVFNLAIQELSDKLSAQELQNQQEYSHNVVVVDIFAREQGKIKIQQGLPETHTVVLWKKAEQEIVLIDPNKFEFSNHISTQQIQALTTLTISSIIPLRLEGDIVYGTQGKTTGYSEYTDPNPLPRDCIDIAVKIAFEINEQQKENIDIKQIEEKVFSQISNNKKLSKYLDKIDGTFIRELQSSNKNTRRDAKQFLKTKEVQLIVPKVIYKDLASIKQVYDAYIRLEQDAEGDYCFLRQSTKGIIQSISQKK